MLFRARIYLCILCLQIVHCACCHMMTQANKNIWYRILCTVIVHDRYGKASERLYRPAPSVYNGPRGDPLKISSSPCAILYSSLYLHLLFTKHLTFCKHVNSIYRLVLQLQYWYISKRTNKTSCDKYEELFVIIRFPSLSRKYFPSICSEKWIWNCCSSPLTQVFAIINISLTFQ